MEISKKEFWIKNGEVLKKEQLPGAFIELGTSLYEVFRVIQGVPIFFEQHIARLKNSSRLTGLALPVDDETIRKSIYDLIAYNKSDTGNAKLVVNYPPGKETGDLYAYFIQEHYPTAEEYQQGIKTVSVKIERPNPNVKVDRADYRQVIDDAKAATGSYEAVLIDHEGYVSEGGRSNVFMIKGQQVFTAPGDKVLKGINRQTVLQVCTNLGYQVIEKDITFEEMLKMDAVFISGTSPQVVPVSHVDDVYIDSANNFILRNIMTGFGEIVAAYIAKNTPRV